MQQDPVHGHSHEEEPHHIPEAHQLYERILGLEERVLSLELQVSVSMVQHAEHRHRHEAAPLVSGPLAPEDTFSDGSPIPEPPDPED